MQTGALLQVAVRHKGSPAQLLQLRLRWLCVHDALIRCLLSKPRHGQRPHACPPTSPCTLIPHIALARPHLHRHPPSDSLPQAPAAASACPPHVPTWAQREPLLLLLLLLAVVFGMV